MRTTRMILAVTALVATRAAIADTFGTGANQFTVDFVTISGSTNPASEIPAGSGFSFSGVGHDYRMGTYDVTNDQWNKFEAALLPGHLVGGYHQSFWTGPNVPVNRVSWFDAAQFVNWLNTSTGHQAAYKFTGEYDTPATWDPSDVGYDSGNPYRNSSAKYYLPTENEWVKAAYWNGTSLQTYATKAGDALYQGNGSNGGWNFQTGYWNYPPTGYWDGQVYGFNPDGPWSVGSGSQELNGTYDMMGNVWQWLESPYLGGDYAIYATRILRGGAYWDYDQTLASSVRNVSVPGLGDAVFGFRVAAAIPEPASVAFLALGGMALLRKRRK